MRSRFFGALLIGTLLSACSLGPSAGQATPQLQATVAAGQTTEPAATPEATAGAEPSATAAAQGNGSYASAKCMFEVPSGLDVECGFLTVPENRTKDNGRTVKIAVGIFKTASKNPKPDPIVYLEGGPGGNALSNWSKNFERIFAPIAGDRDFIIFDQRGTGYSEPSLACQEYTDEAYYQLDKHYTLEESTKRINDALFKCHDRLSKERVDFSAYNSVESAADMDDLRQALGYKEWNVYGISYGTRLALTAMREHPDGIRSVILDSVVPLQSSEAETPADANRSFTTFFEGCAKDEACNTAYPNLKDTFYKLVDQLNANPVTEEATDPDDGKTYKVLLSGDSVIGTLFFALYQTSAIPLMPRAIADAAAGKDYSLLVRLAYLSTMQNKDISVGMLYTVRCNEEIPFDTPEQLAASDDAYPEQRGLFDAGSYTPICNAWDAGKAQADENQAVTSDLPTLVLSGEYDPATPPADAEAAAKTLAKSFYFNFPGYGHGQSVDGGCATDITTAFLDDPTKQPDSACIADLKGPEFAVPEGPITLKSVEITDGHVKSVVPEGWEQVSDVAYANKTGDLAILQFRAAQSAEQTLELLKQQFSITDDVVSSGDHTSAKFTWKLYTLNIQGEIGDVALAEDGGETYVVLVVSPKASHDEIYSSLFIPALDALEPLK